MVDSNNLKRTTDLRGLNAIVRQLRLWNRSQTSLSIRETVTVIECGISLDDIPPPASEDAPVPAPVPTPVPAPAPGAMEGNVRMFPAQIAAPPPTAPQVTPNQGERRPRGRPRKDEANAPPALPLPQPVIPAPQAAIPAPLTAPALQDADTNEVPAPEGSTSELPSPVEVSPVSAAFAAFASVPVKKLEGKELKRIVSKTIYKDGIRCLECGRYFKVLKRHLTETHQMSEMDYRVKWRLPDHYPLVCPEHHKSRQHQRLKQIGREPKKQTLLDAIEDTDGIFKAGKRRVPATKYVTRPPGERTPQNSPNEPPEDPDDPESME